MAHPIGNAKTVSNEENGYTIPGCVDDALGVTPEMIASGLNEYWSFDREVDDPSELVRAVYLAMQSSQG